MNHGIKDIYAGRMSVADLVGFTECMLSAAFSYTRPRREYSNGHGEEHSIVERVFGVYATFVIYYAQPIDYVSKIQASPSDCNNLVTFVRDVLIPGQHMDAYTCLQKLFADDAFRTVLSCRNHDLSNHHQYERPNDVDVLLDERERYEPLEITTWIMEHPAMKAIHYVHRRMEDKSKTIADKRLMESSKTNLITKLQSIYASLTHEMREIDDDQPVGPSNGGKYRTGESSEDDEQNDGEARKGKRRRRY